MNKKSKSIIFAFLLSGFLFLLLTPDCLASFMDFMDIQVPFGDLPAKLKISNAMFGVYVKALFVFASAAITVFAIIMIMVGGVQWILSEGTPDKIGKAKDTIIKAFLGLFIALFSVFILQIVNPGAVDFKPLAITKIQAIGCCKLGPGELDYDAITEDECLKRKGTMVPEGECSQLMALKFGPTSDECPSDTQKKCGVIYKEEASGKECVGKKCDGTTQRCIQNSMTREWACGECINEGGTCTPGQANPCCTNTCTPDGKCASSSLVSAYFGKSCETNKDCEAAGLYCNTNWGNKCIYGRWGAPCDIGLKAELANIQLVADKIECDYKNGFYCNQAGRNTCVRPQPWGRCDPKPGINGMQVCPDGYECKLAILCKKEVNPGLYTSYGCIHDILLNDDDNWGLAGHNNEICMPIGQPCICHGTAANQCSPVKYPINPALRANYNSFAEGACVPNGLGVPCDKNGDCVNTGSKCNTDGPNMCVKGELGDGCNENSDCMSNRCCAPWFQRGICVPPDFKC